MWLNTSQQYMQRNMGRGALRVCFLNNKEEIYGDYPLLFLNKCGHAFRGRLKQLCP